MFILYPKAISKNINMMNQLAASSVSIYVCMFIYHLGDNIYHSFCPIFQCVKVLFAWNETWNDIINQYSERCSWYLQAFNYPHLEHIKPCNYVTSHSTFKNPDVAPRWRCIYPQSNNSTHNDNNNNAWNLWQTIKQREKKEASPSQNTSSKSLNVSSWRFFQ